MNIRKSLMATGLAGLVSLTGCEEFAKPKPGGLATLSGAVMGGPIGQILSTAGSAQAARGTERDNVTLTSSNSDVPDYALAYGPSYTSPQPIVSAEAFIPLNGRSFVCNEWVDDNNGTVETIEIKGLKSEFPRNENLSIGVYIPAINKTNPGDIGFTLSNTDNHTTVFTINAKIDTAYHMFKYNAGQLQPGNYKATWNSNNAFYAESDFSIKP